MRFIKISRLSSTSGNGSHSIMVRLLILSLVVSLMLPTIAMPTVQANYDGDGEVIIPVSMDKTVLYDASTGQFVEAWPNGEFYDGTWEHGIGAMEGYLLHAGLKFSLDQINRPIDKVFLEIYVSYRHQTDGSTPLFINLYGSNTHTWNEDTSASMPTNDVSIRQNYTDIFLNNHIRIDVTDYIKNSSDFASFLLTGNTTGTGMVTWFPDRSDSTFPAHHKARLHVFYQDNSPPENGSILINAGADYTNSRNVVLNISGTDPDGDDIEVQFSNDNETWGEWQAFSPTINYTLPSGDGTKTVYMKMRDIPALEESSISQDTIILDTTAPTGSLQINNGNTHTNDPNVTLTISGNDNLSGVSEMRLANSESALNSAAWEPYSTTKSWSLNGADGEKTVYLQLRDAAGNTSVVVSYSIILDRVQPVVTGVAHNGLYNVPVTITFDKGTATLNSNPFTSGSTVSADGEYSLVVTDAAGNVTTISFTIDQTPPTGSIQINDGATHTNNPSVTLTIEGSDNASGTLEMRLAHTIDGLGAALWEPLSTTKAWTLNGEDGEKTVYLQLRDLAGNTSLAISDSIILDRVAPEVDGVVDGGVYNTPVTITFNKGTATLNSNPFTSGSTVSADGEYNLIVSDAAGNVTEVDFTIDQTPPTGSLEINGGATHTNNPSLSLTISGSDNFAGDLEMRLAHTIDGLGAAQWEPFSTSKDWIIDGEDGEKTVYLQLRDLAGNISQTISDSIILDRIAPVVDGVVDGGVYNTPVTITFNKGEATLNSNPFTSGSIVSADGEYSLVVTDAAGNETEVDFTIDQTPPTGSLEINGGATHTNNPSVTLTIAGSDNLSGLGEMRFANSISELEDANWEPFSTSKAWTIDGEDGEKTIYLQLRDLAGNISQTFSATITLYRVAPVVDGVVDGGLYNTPVTITFNKGTATLNGHVFTSGSTVDADGEYTLIVTDAVGNETTVTFTIDRTSPTGSLEINDGATHTNDPNVSLTIDGTDNLSGLFEMRLANSIANLEDADWEPFSTSKDWTLEGEDGEKTVYLQLRDLAGNISTNITATITLYRVPPVVDGVADGGLYNTPVTITFNKGTATLNGHVFTSGSTVDTDGAYTLIVTDAVGNVTTVTFTIDRTSPTGSLEINDGATHTNDPNVSLTIDGTDNLSGLFEMRLANSAAELDHAVWEPFGTSRDWSLDGEDGENTVYLQLKDLAGNTSITISATIILDRVAPVIDGVVDGGIYNSAVTITFNEGEATLNGVELPNGSTVIADGEYTLIVTDAAGNVTTLTFTIDTTPPTGTLVINNGVPLTSTTNVNLTITGDDGDGVGVVEMRFSNIEDSWENAIWEPFAETKQWTLTAGDGNKTVYMQLKDAAGNVSESVFSTIRLASPIPRDPPSTPRDQGQSKQEPYTLTQEEINRNSVINVSLNTEYLKERVNQDEPKSITIEINDDFEELVSTIEGDTLALLKENNIELEYVTSYGQYRLPLAQLAKQLTGDDIEIRVTMKSTTNAAREAFALHKERANIEMYVPDKSFIVELVKRDGIVELQSFDHYVQHYLPIPKDFSEVTTAVMLLPDGSIMHLPSKIIEQNGQQFLEVNTLLLGEIAFVNRSIQFKDIAGHWSQAAVENLAAKMIVNGVDTEHFAPNREINRAEFVTILTRGLGIWNMESTPSFNDIDHSNWYYHAVNTAVSFDLINGFSDNTFKPEENITREQGMALMVRTLEMMGLNTTLSEDEIQQLLVNFEDKDSISSWAQESVALSIKLGLFTEEDDLLTPKHFLSRGEMSVMIEQVLKHVHLID